MNIRPLNKRVFVKPASYSKFVFVKDEYFEDQAFGLVVSSGLNSQYEPGDIVLYSKYALNDDFKFKLSLEEPVIRAIREEEIYAVIKPNHENLHI